MGITEDNHRVDYKRNQKITADDKSAEPILKVDNLKTYFYTEEGVVKAVDGVSFNIYKDEVLGIELIAENVNEQDIIQRFWRGGIKINGITNTYKLHLTFKDLINKR